MGLIKFILITVLILYIIRVIVRLIFPLVLRKLFSNMQQQAQHTQQSQQHTHRARQRPEGDISVAYTPPSAKTGKTEKLGDFVDYEEIK